MDKIIKVTFNESIVRGDTFSSISIKAGENSVAYLASVGYNAITIYPSANLDHGTRYTVTIPSGAVKDGSCNLFKNTYTFSFTTVKLGDLNGDDQVDILDPLWISSRLGPVVDPASRKADVNGDNVVNILDLLEVAQYLNLSTGS